MTTKETVEEFATVVREEFGLELSREDARCNLTSLGQYFDTLLRMKHEQEVEVRDVALS